jgi:signal transduction histidine kinase/ABC-type amino acid transport substrate-binding protein
VSRIPCFLIGAVLCILAPAAAWAQRPLSAPRKIVVAVQSDFPPLYSRTPKTGQPQGFAIDVMNEIARRAGITVTYITGKTWEESQQMILDGRADVIPTLTINEERKRLFAFTSPVDTLPVSYIVRNDGLFNGLRGGMRAGVMRGSAAQGFLQGRDDIQLVPNDSLHRLLVDLLAGDLDIVLTPAHSIVKLALDLGIEDRIRVLEPPVLDGVRAMALRPGERELRERLNHAIGQFVGTPEYRVMYYKWWGKPKPFWTTAKVVWAVAVTLLLSAMGMGYWRYASVVRLNHTLEQSREELLRSEERSRNLAQEAVRERTRSQAILEGIQDGISIQDREYRVLYQNSHFIAMVGEHSGEFCFQAYQHKDAPCDGCPLTAAFRDGLPHSRVMTLSCLAGPLYIDILASPLLDEQGEIVSVITNIRDVTARKQMEDALHEQAILLEQEIAERQQTQESLAVKQRQIEEINEVLAGGINEAVAELRHKDQMLIQQGRLAAMGEMINNIAHQWRQPLNNIGLIVQNLQLAYESGDLTATEFTKESSKAMDVILHMSHTIDDFRNFFRQDKEKRAFVINTAVSRSLEFVAATLESCQIRVDMADGEQVSAIGYQNEYAQVLLNILNNARDALMERMVAVPLVSIRITSENSRSVVIIRDNGGGMAEDILPRIFDPYFTTKEPGKGTGIGLYMSKVIIEQHMDGRLSARNVEDGAEFRIEV